MKYGDISSYLLVFANSTVFSLILHHYSLCSQCLLAGIFKIPLGVVSPKIDPLGDKLKVPGPGAYTPHVRVRYKRPPSYSMRPAARPPYQPFDMWTAPPNMYYPPIPGKYVKWLDFVVK